MCTLAMYLGINEYLVYRLGHFLFQVIGQGWKFRPVEEFIQYILMKEPGVCRFEFEIFDCGVIRVGHARIPKMCQESVFLEYFFYSFVYMVHSDGIQFCFCLVKNAAQGRCKVCVKPSFNFDIKSIQPQGIYLRMEVDKFLITVLIGVGVIKRDCFQFLFSFTVSNRPGINIGLLIPQPSLRPTSAWAGACHGVFRGYEFVNSC